MTVASVDMKGSFIREKEKKKKRNKKIMSELQAEKKKLSEQMRRDDDQLELQFRIKQLNMDEEPSPEVEPGSNDQFDIKAIMEQNRLDQKTTVQPVSKKHSKASAKMKIFDDSEEHKDVVVVNHLKMKQADEEEEEEVEELKEAGVVVKEEEKKEEIDRMFEEFADSMISVKKEESKVDETLLDFDKSICQERKIVTPFD